MGRRRWRQRTARLSVRRSTLRGVGTTLNHILSILTVWGPTATLRCCNPRVAALGVGILMR